MVKINFENNIRHFISHEIISLEKIKSLKNYEFVLKIYKDENNL